LNGSGATLQVAAGSSRQRTVGTAIPLTSFTTNEPERGRLLGKIIPRHAKNLVGAGCEMAGQKTTAQVGCAVRPLRSLGPT